MSKLDQIKIPIDIANNEDNSKFKLVRERDGLTKFSKSVKWIEWDGIVAKKLGTKPKIGRSLVMSPFNAFFTWQTTTLTEIVEETDEFISFKTKNSNYKLYYNE